MNNLDLTASFIIGGLLIVALVTFFLYVHDASFSTTMHQIQQSNITEMGRVIEYDMEKIGYRVQAGDKILRLGPQEIQFLADLNNDGVVDSVHYFTSVRASVLKLIRHTSLARDRDFSMDVAGFSVVGYDSTDQTTSDRLKVKSVEIKLQLQQNHLLQTQQNQDVGAYWVRRFFPKNL